jgi:serine/threonine protein kinase
MPSDRDHRILALFEAAQEQPVEMRPKFLKLNCPEDAALRAEVESLLAQDATSFLESSPSLPSLSSGMKLGVYELRSLLGRGGMGEVWRAHDPRLKRDVAIKILPLVFAGDPDRVHRFEREAHAASALNHTNIVSIYDVGREQGFYWIVSELVEGETLSDLIKRGPVPLKKLVDIGAQICDGLAAAHAAGIVHRDLKPGNIMLTRSGRVKILDFGLAKQRHPLSGTTQTSDLTGAGLVMGTPGYMSPEQVRSEDVDARSDLFSLGAILYEMLAGKPAFTGNSSIEIMHAVLNSEPREIPPKAPGPLVRIIQRCLEKAPALRFQSAADLGFALGSVTDSMAPAVPGSKKRSRAVWLLAVAMLCAVAAIAVYLWRSHSPPSNISSNVTFRRVTNDSGLTTGAAISNDGKLVAYASDRDNPEHLNLYVQQVDGGGVLRITDGPADDYDPSFSPDGTQIAFRSDRGAGGIYVVPAIGGEARMVVPEGRRPRFSPDGQRLMYWTGPQVVNVTGSGEARLWVRPVSGGEPVQLAAGCRLFERSTMWSPDGSRVLFIGICGHFDYSSPEDYGISGWVSTADGKSLKPNRQLYRVWPTIHSPDQVSIDQWLSSPSRVLIPIRLGDATTITTLPISADGTSVTGSPERIMFAGGDDARISVAANGRMVLSADTSQSHVWSLPIDSNGKASGPLRQLTSGTAGEFASTLSADGQKLAFLSNRANGVRLFYKDLTTDHEKELSTEGYRYATPLFNTDGTRVLCVQYPSATSWRNFVFEIPISGGVSRKIWDKGIFAWLFDWSPDGTTLLLHSFGPGVVKGPGVLQMDLQSFSYSKILASDTMSPDAPHFSHSGKWMAFLLFPRGKSVVKDTALSIAPFRKIPVPRGEWILLSQGNFESPPRFSEDDHLLLFISKRDGFGCVWAQRLTRDMHADGAPFAVYHAHERRHPILSLDDGVSVGPHAIVFDRQDLAGNIWLLEPAKEAK